MRGAVLRYGVFYGPGAHDDQIRLVGKRLLPLMDLGRPRFDADRREREELAARFFDALRDGDVDGLRELLAADVQMAGDGGGKAPALARSVIGADNVARVLASVFPVLARIGATVEGSPPDDPARVAALRSPRRTRCPPDRAS